MIYIFADLEAYSTSYYNKHNSVKEYIIGGKDLDDTFLIEDITARGWLEQLKELKVSATVFFHNLGGYDGHFLINPIVNMFGKKNVKYFMDEKKKIYEVSATYRYRDKDDLNEKGQPKRKKVTLKFRDSWKIWPLSVKAMGKAIGMEKLDYGDYDILDEFNSVEEYKEYNNGISYEYFIRDIDILVQFAKLTNDIMPLKDYKLTMASTAMTTWKKTNQHAEAWLRWVMMINNGNDEVKAWEANYNHWKDVKAAYKGGITWANPEYQLKELNNVYVYDINSMYPGVMLNLKLPYGSPYYSQENAEHNKATYRIYKVHIKHAKTDRMPFIATPPKDINKSVVDIMKGLAEEKLVNTADTETYSKVITDDIIYMNNYTLELFEKEYTGEWTLEFVCAYKEKYGQFDEYINKFKNIKETSKGAIRELAKLFLNSLYGKFGQDIQDLSAEILNLEDVKDQLEYTEKQVYLNGERVIINEDLVYVNVDNGYKRNISYIAMAEAITAKARVQLVTAILDNWENFVYCDTDSIHLLAPAKNIELHATQFGDWAFEGCWKKAVYRRPKHYAHYGLSIDEDFNEVDDDEAFELKGGGFNVGAFKSAEDMPIERYLQKQFTVKDGKTNSYIVNGGVVIIENDYEFTMPSSYRGQNNEN